MLSLALAATLVGFVLLIVGLITGTVWLAVACIVVCLIGLAFLIVDIIGSGRRDDSSSVDAEFDGRPAVGDDSDAGVEGDGAAVERDDPARDRDVGGDRDGDAVRGSRPSSGPDSGGSVPTGPARRESPPARREGPPSSWEGVIKPGGQHPGERPDSAPGSAGAVGDSAHGASGRDASADPAPGAREGDYTDYLRAVGNDPVTGGFGAQPPGTRPPQSQSPQSQSPQSQSGAPQMPPPQAPRHVPPGQQRAYPQQGPAGGQPPRQWAAGPGTTDQGRGQQSPGQYPGRAPQAPSEGQQVNREEQQPSDRQWDTPERETGSGTARFDPLDPNWRPPLD